MRCFTHNFYSHNYYRKLLFNKRGYAFVVGIAAGCRSTNSTLRYVLSLPRLPPPRGSPQRAAGDRERGEQRSVCRAIYSDRNLIIAFFVIFLAPPLQRSARRTDRSRPQARNEPDIKLTELLIALRISARHFSRSPHPRTIYFPSFCPPDVRRRWTRARNECNF